MSGHRSVAEAAARRALRQAAWPPLLVLGAVAVRLASPSDAPSMPAAAGLAVAGLGGLAVLALSANLAFDALLFRVVASYEEEVKGGAAVDDILTRMRLKPAPDLPRPLADRIAGTERLVLRQRAACAVFVAASLFHLLA